MQTKTNYHKLKIMFGAFVLILGFLITFFSTHYIYYNGWDVSPRNRDIILDNLKPNPTAMFITEIILVIAFLLFIYHNKDDKETLIDSAILFGLFTCIRGLMLPLTPMGGFESYGFLTEYITFSRGLFPSGHTALALVFFFKTKKFRLFYGLIAILVATGLLFAQQHYTIDIVSSVIFVYAIKSFMEKHL